MSKHHSDTLLCRKRVGTALGKVCSRCEGRCPICDAHCRSETAVQICDECNFLMGIQEPKCIICNAKGARAQAYYCHECTMQGLDRNGCPQVVSLGSARLDAIFEKSRKDRENR